MPEIHEQQVSTQNKYLASAVETEKAEEGQIEGAEIPGWVKGVHLRASPGLFDLKDMTVNHWLDGYSIFSRYEINGSKPIKFTKKYLNSDAYKRAIASGKPCVIEFGTKAYSDPNKSLFSRVLSSLLPEFTDNCNATIYPIGKDMFVKADTGLFWKFDPTTLEALEKYDAQKIHGVTGVSAHPIVDENGDCWNIGSSLMTGLKYQVIKIPNCAGGSSKEMMKKAKTIATIPCRFSTMLASIHSFGCTENYIVFIEQPFGILPTRVAASIVKGDSCVDWLDWRPNDKNKFYIVEKATGKVIKTEYFSNDTFHTLHTANCYEENSHIILDIVTYGSPKYLYAMNLHKLRTNNFDSVDPAYPERYVIPLVGDLKDCPEGKNLISLDYAKSATAIRKGNQIILTPERFVEDFQSGFEMPMINRKYFGKKYRYFYGTSTIHPSFFQGALTKIDTLTKEVIIWKEGEDLKPGEPVFVANPNGTEEDDGVLVSAVSVNDVSKHDFLIFLDAKNMKEIARTEFKNDIPCGLHGIFLPTST